MPFNIEFKDDLNIKEGRLLARLKNTRRLGFETTIDGRMELIAGRAKELLSKKGYEIGPTPEITIALYDKRLPEKYKRAYYDKRDKTIHSKAKWFGTEVISHEVAHALLDQYYPNLPERTHENLARFVHSHLLD